MCEGGTSITGHLYHVCSDTYGDGHLAGYDLREGADFLEEPVQTGGHQLHEHPNLTLPGEGRGGGEGRGEMNERVSTYNRVH